MKDTDKVTLTLGQLKRLVAESTSDDALIDKALEKVMAAGSYKEEDPMICFFTDESTITSFDFDDVRDDFEGSEEFEDFDWDDKSIGNYKKFLSIISKIKDDYNLDSCLNTPANLNKLLKKYAEDIIEYGGHSYPDSTGFVYTPPKCADCGKSLPGDGSGTDRWGGPGPRYVSLDRDDYDEPIQYVCWDCFKKNHKEEYEKYMSDE